MTDKDLLKRTEKGFGMLEELIDEFAEKATSHARIYGELTALAKKIVVEADTVGVDKLNLRELLRVALQKRGVSEEVSRKYLARSELQLQNILPVKTENVRHDSNNVLSPTTTTVQPERIIEVKPAQPVPEPEPPKAKLLEVTLSKKEFETDLRMFLLNRQQQFLTLHVDVQLASVVRIS